MISSGMNYEVVTLYVQDSYDVYVRQLWCGEVHVMQNQSGDDRGYGSYGVGVRLIWGYGNYDVNVWLIQVKDTYGIDLIVIVWTYL